MTEFYKIRLDSVQIGATNIREAAANYADLLDTIPRSTPDGLPRFQLEIGAVELVEGEPGIRSIRFVAEGGGDAPARCDVLNGLSVWFSPALPPFALPPSENVEAIDHVVVNTQNVSRALALWRDKLGTRLAP
ncbi:MAG: hypothetical protein HY270_18500, partial [Deltaproteobacteria bacterium]|nr:hypothetical protein [Deltaproteobacteria bacterium]